MKVQKSALPYIILLLGLFVGVPTTDYLLNQEKGNETVVISIDNEFNMADNKNKESTRLAKHP